MKNKTLYIGICLLLSACGNFLEPKSKSEFTPKEATSLDELLVGEAYPRPDVRGMNVFLGMLDDDIACAPYQEEAEGVQNRTIWHAVYSWQPDVYYKFKENGFESYNLYQTFYSKILGTNAVLDYLDDAQGSADEKNAVQAQALALRGFYYFTLVNLYGAPYSKDKEAPGVPLKLNSGIGDKAMSRNTVEEVYQQILEDLEEAERLYQTLPESDQWKSNYKTSLPMVQLLLSRVHLYMENWDNAATYAGKIINDYSFRLIDLNEIADTIKNGSRTYYNYISYNSPEVIWPYGSIEDVTYMTAQMGKQEEYWPYRQHSMFKASEELLQCYEETPGDLRATRYIVRESPESYINGVKYYVPQAFSKFSISSDYRPNSGGQYCARAFRLSEAYLNLAEASAMEYKTSGNGQALSNALNALYTLRNYRIESNQQINITDADLLIQFIKNERRREFCFEDHRWFDLRRWGMESIKHVWVGEATGSLTYILEEDDPSYTLPIPPEALEVNKLLIQNPQGSERTGTINN